MRTRQCITFNWPPGTVVDAEFAAFEARIDAAFAGFTAELKCWILVAVFCNDAISVAVNAVLNGFQP